MCIFNGIERVARGGALQGIVNVCNEKLLEKSLDETIKKVVVEMRDRALKEAASEGHEIDPNGLPEE